MVARRLAPERGQLQAGIAERTRGLALAKQFFRGLTDTLPSPIGYWDGDLRNRFANTALGRWLAMAPQALTGRTLGELQGRSAAPDEARYRAALAGQPQVFERQQQRPDGEDLTTCW
ncbi:MAG: PAS domain-containing protein [Comamonadaceae bacterium]|nr:PAS domain-containing protein [Comamonadaceae bacterium]